MNIWNVIGSMARKIFNPPAMPVIKKMPVTIGQYYQNKFKKTHIYLHHTAGGSAASSVNHWNSKPDHIATAYIIDRDGTIYETFPPEYWSYHLGAGSTKMEQASIGIEICSYGALTDGKTYTGKLIDPAKRVAVDFRGESSWEKYTPEQVEAVRQLLVYLMDRFEIKKQEDIEDFYEYRQNPGPGIWSHTTVRKDKIDIFPQPDLVEMVKGF